MISPEVVIRRNEKYVVIDILSVILQTSQSLPITIDWDDGYWIPGLGECEK